MEVLFTLSVDDPDAVELCLKAFMKPYIYRKKKEYYECNIKLLRETIIKCNKLIMGEFHCNQCQSRIESFDKLIEHTIIDHNISDNDNLFFDILQNQSGGTFSIDYYEKYMKYKKKYLALRLDLIKNNNEYY